MEPSLDQSSTSPIPTNPDFYLSNTPPLNQSPSYVPRETSPSSPHSFSKQFNNHQSSICSNDSREKQQQSGLDHIYICSNPNPSKTDTLMKSSYEDDQSASSEHISEASSTQNEANETSAKRSIHWNRHILSNARKLGALIRTYLM